MQLAEPSAVTIDVERGELHGSSGRYAKYLRDLAGHYQDEAAFAAAIRADGAALAYEVTELRPSNRSGDLVFGVTRMLPGTIGDEFYLTRGHLHAIADRPEIYRGEAGRGVMLLESPHGETRALAMAPGVVCYVPPYWIHRSVNVGPETLVMSFCYPADAGQDYAVLERAHGMRHRVTTDDRGGWRLAENRAYRPRTPAEIAAIFQPSQPGIADV
jgi:glucose-6-phosphate isomerase